MTKTKQSGSVPSAAESRFLFEDVRMAELQETIGQLLSSGMPIPTELIDEYNELVDRLPFDN